MSVPYFGDFPEDATVYIPFNTFSSDDPSASVTITDLVDGDLKVHKDGSTDEIVTDGATITINFDGVTGNHVATIDTSADAAYATGSEYLVRMEGVTVDGATINAWIGSFSIERAGGVIALLKLIQAAVITNAAGADVAADIIAVKAETALIVADTGELQVDDYPTSIAAVQTTVDAIEAATITNAAGTDVAADIIAVKAETALIVADTGELQVDDYPTSIAAVQTTIDAIEAAVITNAAGTDVAADIIAVKAETATIVNDTDVIDDGTSGLVKIAQDVAAILTDTGTDGVILKAAGLDADAVDEILDEEVDNDGTGISLRGAIKLILSILTAKSSGGGTSTLVFRDINDSKDRLSCTVDGDGNRTAVGTRDAS